jgi:SAM-dependent methyltransferase
MSLPQGFLEIYAAADRQGPGETSDVVWALNESGLSGRLAVLDAGCGTGADTFTLAQALPEARIEAVDREVAFVEGAKLRLQAFGPQVAVREGDMGVVAGPYDLIWCAGALYFPGVTEGLSAWRPALNPGAWVAFSEPVFLSSEPSEAARAFWAGDGAVGDMASVQARVAAADYEVKAERILTGAPWEAYYGPLRQSISAAKAEGMGDDYAEAIAGIEAEIACWEAARDEIAYVLMLVQPA